jgi:hypothetical protein
MSKGPGSKARLGYMGHVLVENRSGLVVQHLLTTGSGMAFILALAAYSLVQMRNLAVQPTTRVRRPTEICLRPSGRRSRGTKRDANGGANLFRPISSSAACQVRL